MIRGLIIAAAAALSCSGCISTLFGLGVYGEVRTWCPLPCNARQTCESPYSADEVCAELEQSRADQGGSVYVSVRWREGELSEKGDAVFINERGSRVAGDQGKAFELRVAFVDGMPVCRTALRHENRHSVLFVQTGDWDIHHQQPGWARFNGCR